MQYLIGRSLGTDLWKRSKTTFIVVSVSMAVGMLFIACEEPAPEYDVTVEIYTNDDYVISETTYDVWNGDNPVTVSNCDTITVTGGESYVFRSLVTWTTPGAGGPYSYEFQRQADMNGDAQRVVFANVTTYFDDDPADCN